MKKIPHFTEKDRAKTLCILILTLCVLALFGLIFYAPLGLIIPFVLGLVLVLIAIKKQSREQYELQRIKEKLNNEKNTSHT